MKINEALLQSLLPGKTLAVQVGLSRTAVMVETEEGVRCGLAATLSNPELDHRRQPSVRHAGYLHQLSTVDLASLIDSPSFTEVGIGLATINALLPRNPSSEIELNAEDYLVEHGMNKNIALIGHFSFVDRLRLFAQNLWVLELNPKAGDLPAHLASEVIPKVDLVAITATTLINKTFQGLIDLCRLDTRVIMIGPSTPLSPTLYEHKIDVLSGAIITNPQETLTAVGQGISLQQLRQRGFIRFVTMKKDHPSGNC